LRKKPLLFKLTKGDAPDISQMNARVRELLEGAIQSDGIEELFETGKFLSEIPSLELHRLNVCFMRLPAAIKRVSKSSVS